MKKFRIIIPSWAALSLDMQVETGCEYPAFIRFGGDPLYLHILHFYREIRHEAEFVLILPEIISNLELNNFKDYDVKVLYLSESSSIGETVSASMDGLHLGQSVIVHMADTLISSVISLDIHDVFYVQLRRDLYRWTSVKKRDDGSIKVLKDRDRNNFGGEQMVFVGVFIFTDVLIFKDQLSIALSTPHSNIDPFFVAVEVYSEIKKVELRYPQSWYDCGHIDSYYESRLNYQNIRHFNSLTYDEERGIVTKRSQKLDAFRHQVRWFKQVPDDLSSFLPRIYESSDGLSPYISMELLSIPTLSEIFVNARLKLGAWNEVARKINLIQSIFCKYTFSSAVAKNIVSEIYVKKTLNRILQFYEQSSEVSRIRVDVCGRRFGLDDVLSTLENYVEVSGLLEIEALTPIHGDLCFSNIMYDSRSNHIKLIDPRGEFGIPGIYGDLRYDKAKLRHSYAGGYDFIVSDLFDVSFSADYLLSCKINRNDYHSKVGEIFDAILFKDKDERRQCDAIQALLFLSMLPLHNDKPERQLAMLYVGLTEYAHNLYERD